MKSKLQQWPDWEVGESCLFPGNRQGEITAERWTSLLKFQPVRFVTRPDRMTAASHVQQPVLYTVKYIIREGRRVARRWSRAPSEPIQRFPHVVPGPRSQYGHASCECLCWKISCLSTWQTPSSLSERELKINSLMASQSARTSMWHKQAHASSHACYTGSHIFKCV